METTMAFLRKITILFLLSISIIYIPNLSADTILTKIVNKKIIGNETIGIGSTINLSSTDLSLSGESIFLGSAVRTDGQSIFDIYFNKLNLKIEYIDSHRFANRRPNLQKVLDPVPQVGGTCTGYAINNYLNQISLSPFIGNGQLSVKLSTEEGRTELLVDSINRYYLMSSHRYSISGILKGFGIEYGFTCQSLQTNNYEKVKNKILSQLDSGYPVIVAFDFGPEMAKSPFQMEKVDSPDSELDDRLWIPRKRGERNSGGHTIVAAGSFEFNQKTYLVMVDSDWSEPRVWDMESFLNEKTAIDEIDFVFCK
jgi:hypothetical protein